MKTLKTFFGLTLVGLTLSAYQPPKNPIETLKEMKKALKNSYAYVPSGLCVVDGDTVSVQGFFIFKTEVSNFNYQEYLFSLKKQGDKTLYNAALPDTSRWTAFDPKLKDFEHHYFKSPTYRSYPVVNITKEQAKNYCAWLSKVWQQNTGNSNIRFRLPKRAEFIRAANGDNYSKPFAWKGNHLRNEQGLYLCNFHSINQKSIYRNPKTKQYEVLDKNSGSRDLMAPTKSYFENAFGIYNLNGNVAEMVNDKDIAVGGSWIEGGKDVTNTSFVAFEGACPYIGFRPVMTFVSSKK